MGISLAKGQKINLSKSGSGTLQRVFMGLGWACQTIMVSLPDCFLRMILIWMHRA